MLSRCSAMLVGGVILVVGCSSNSLDPYDPARCTPRCAPAQVCFEGVCVSASDAAIEGHLTPDTLLPDAAEPDALLPDATEPDAAPICGNGTVEPGEDCDGALLGGKDCLALGCLGGQLACTPGCSFDKSSCTLCSCGDGVIDAGESCDKTNLNGKTCASFGYTGSGLACKTDCTFDKSGCCGDGNLGPGEECDKTNLGGKTCSSLGYAGYGLVCRSDCTLDKSACCGDGTVGGAEECDGAALGGKDCIAVGCQGGQLGCDQTCKLDKSNCVLCSCGDGVIDAGEECDKTNLNGKTCPSFGYTGSGLACKADCTFDKSACCGDGTVGGTEDCDGTNLDGKACASFGYTGSGLSCKADCTFDTSACCGDGTVAGAEECDGTNFVGKTCTGLGFASGNLSCTKTCAISRSTCNTAGFSTISAGTFTMGSPTSEPCRYWGTGGEDQHQVTLTHGFEIQSTEVTQGQFLARMGYNPTYFPSCGQSCPEEDVSWHEAAAYCNALSAQVGLTACYSCTGAGPTIACTEAPGFSGKDIYGCPGYRLPTDAEWEYAYRAGTTSALYSGAKDPATCLSGADPKADPIAWYDANSGNTTHPVGQKAANAWGLYDMAGNVEEWCHDWFQTNLGFSAVTDPWGAPSGSSRVIRGGAYRFSAGGLRAAMRSQGPPSGRGDPWGFRCCRTK